MGLKAADTFHYEADHAADLTLRIEVFQGIVYVGKGFSHTVYFRAKVV